MKDKLYYVYEFCNSYGIARSTFYREVKAGRLRVLKCGHRTLVADKDIERWCKRRYKIRKYKPKSRCHVFLKRVLLRHRTFSFGGCFKLFIQKQK